MFLALLYISIAWVAVFIASAAFDIYFEIERPSLFTDNPVGRFFAAIFIAPLILTIGITAFVALPLCFGMDLLEDRPSRGDYAACDECWDTIEATFEWFFNWAPTFVTTGEE